MNISEKLNKTVRDMKPSGIRKFFDVVATMPDAISLGVENAFIQEGDTANESFIPMFGDAL